MFSIISWIIYGLIVGCVAKMIHPGEDPKGVLTTMLIGVAGSYVGGFIHWAVGLGGDPISSSGFIFGIFGGILVLSLWMTLFPDEKDPRDVLKNNLK